MVELTEYAIEETFYEEVVIEKKDDKKEEKKENKEEMKKENETELK